MAKKDLQGTLDLLVLKTLSLKGEMHGYGIVLHVQQVSDNLLNIEEGLFVSRSPPHGTGRMDQVRMGADGDGA